MSIGVFRRFYRLVFGALTLSAVITQFLTFRQSPVNFFSYFTVLSNLLVASTFIYISWRGTDTKLTDFVRGAGTLYVLTTGLGFIVLLGGNNSELVPWVNIVLHYLSPLVAFLDWFFAPSVKITFKQLLYWLLFLIVYLTYSLIRGWATSWYPYGFLNPEKVGYEGIAKYALILTVNCLVLSLLLVKFSGRNKNFNS